MIPSHIVTINLEYALLRIYSRKFKKALYFMQFYQEYPSQFIKEQEQYAKESSQGHVCFNPKFYWFHKIIVHESPQLAKFVSMINVNDMQRMISRVGRDRKLTPRRASCSKNASLFLQLKITDPYLHFEILKHLISRNYLLLSSLYFCQACSFSDLQAVANIP